MARMLAAPLKTTQEGHGGRDWGEPTEKCRKVTAVHPSAESSRDHKRRNKITQMTPVKPPISTMKTKVGVRTIPADMHSSHRGGLLNARLWWPGAIALLSPWDISYTRPLLLRSGDIADFLNT